MFKTNTDPGALATCVKLFALFLAFVLVAGVCLSAEKPVSDDAIYDRIRLKLARDSEMKVGDLQIDVKQGVVTLSGNALSSRLKGKAERLAKKVKGVKQVINNIEIPKQE